MACLPQSWNWLENRGSKDDKVYKRVWKTVEAEAGKTRVAKTERWKDKRERGKETRRKGVENQGSKWKEKTKNDKSKEGGRGMGNLG